MSGAKLNSYTVGTFVDGNRIHCYLRDYHRDWNSCKEYTVIASSGEEAKKKAKALRREHEDNAKKTAHP